MTFYVENETDGELPFQAEDVVKLVCEAVLEAENCPYEVQVNVVLTDNAGIHELNREYRCSVLSECGLFRGRRL